MLPEQYLKLSSRRNYNARKHRLAYHIEALRRKISERLIASESDNIKIIDSMPIEACRYSRAKRCKILKGDENMAPTFGFCAT